MKTVPGQLYRARYSLPSGGPLLKKVAERFTEKGLKVSKLEDYGADKPAWLEVDFTVSEPTEEVDGRDYGGGLLLVSTVPISPPPVSNWPGIGKVTQDDIKALWLAIPPLWELDALLGHISSESGFNPLAKAANSTARGLIQMIDAVAAKYGRGGSTFQSQIPGIVAYFKDAGKEEMRGSDFKVAGFSQAATTKSDSFILYPAGSKAAKMHPAQQDAAGNMTVGSIRSWWDGWTARVLKGGAAVLKKAGASAGVVGALAIAGLGLLLFLAGKRR